MATSLAALAAAGVLGGQALGQGGPITVGEAPIHAVPAETAAPMEANAPPNTLNAQYAAQYAAQHAGPGEARAAPQSRAPEGPAVEVAPAIIDAAGHFAGFMRKAGAIDPKFVDGGAVAKAVATGSGYEIGEFQEGMVAYAALAALQEPGFVQSVYEFARDPRDRDALAERLLADPHAVLEIDQAEVAAADVGGVLAQMGAELVKSGQGVKQAARDVQHDAWSKEAAPDPQLRLAEAKQRSALKTEMSPDDTATLIQAVVALRKAGAGVGGRAAPPSPVVVRGLALAALAVLGRAGEADMAKLEPLLTDAKSADCMKMAKLNLYQCLAVAGPHYEHAYCLGQHALMDTGQCVVSAAGQSPIPTGLQSASAAKPSRAVHVPIALTSPAGPERSQAYARLPATAPPAPQAAPPAAEPAPPPLREADIAPAPPVREAAPTRYAERDDRYAERGPLIEDRDLDRDQSDDRYDRDEEQDRGRWDRQDYDPYAPPAYAYRYGR